MSTPYHLSGEKKETPAGSLFTDTDVNNKLLISSEINTLKYEINTSV